MTDRRRPKPPATHVLALIHRHTRPPAPRPPIPEATLWNRLRRRRPPQP